MMIRALVLSFAAFAIAVSNARAQPQRADDLLRSLPRVDSLYERRLDNVATGNLQPGFTGMASVAPNSSFRAIVSIGLKGVAPQLGHFCGGVFVGPRWVLTAAHCVSPGAGVTADKIQVLSGTNVLYRGGNTTAVTRIVVHPSYRVTARGVPENDLALLELHEPAGAAHLKIASATESAALIAAGRSVLIGGWGTATFEANSPISSNLLFAFVEVADRAKCNASYGGAIDDGMFCAGSGFADSCQGDSGGPALGFERGTPALVGITSWGLGCTHKEHPGVYVNVAKYTGWINETVGQK